MRWEYAPLGKPVSAVGTLEQCQDAATDELMPKPEPTVAVVKVHHSTTQPSYKAQYAQGYRASWKTVGAGDSTKVTVKDAAGEFDIWIPATFAAKVRVGSSYIHRHDSVTHQDYLAWSSRPVRRSAIAA